MRKASQRGRFQQATGAQDLRTGAVEIQEPRTAQTSLAFRLRPDADEHWPERDVSFGIGTKGLRTGPGSRLNSAARR
jgi:hypothetical protein